jgi:hypothetical protein
MGFDFDVHVCLVSEQPTPNLQPLLDETLGPKAKKAILLVSPQMRKQAKDLAAAVKDYGITTETIEIEDVFNIREIQNKLLDCPDVAENSNTALNLTGGTKIMTIAAQSVFAEASKPIFYVKESDNEVLVIPDGSDVLRGVQTIPLKNTLRMKDYLRASGYITEPGRYMTKELPEFTKELINNPKKYEDALRQVNELVSGKNNKKILDFKLDRQHYGTTLHLLRLCEKYKLLEFDDRSLAFADESARLYVCGGWLEEYVFDVLRRLNKQNIQDKAINLTIRGAVENELDVAFLAKNRLHLIECKTARLRTEKGGETLYKLKRLMEQTGRKTKGMLVSYRDLDRSNKTPHKKRAKEYGIKVVQKDDLRNLKNLLEQWIAEK